MFTRLLDAIWNAANDPSRRSRERSPRVRVGMIARVTSGVVIGVVAVVFVAVQTYEATHVDWAGARHAVEALSPPLGFHVTRVEQSGSSNCPINPACNPPMVNRYMASSGAHTYAEVCAALRQVLPTWKRHGLRRTSWEFDPSAGRCAVLGWIHGQEVRVGIEHPGEIYISSIPANGVHL